MRKSSLALVSACMYMVTLGGVPPSASIAILVATAALCVASVAGVGLRSGFGFFAICFSSVVCLALISSYIAHRNGLDAGRSVQFSIRLLAPGIFFTIGYCSGLVGNYRFVYWGVVAVACVHAGLAFGSALLGVAPIIGGVVRPDGFLTPNVVANSAMLGAVVAFVMFYLEKDRSQNNSLLAAFAFVFVLSFLVISATLKNIVALVPALLVAFYFINKSQRLLKVAIASVVIAPVALLGILISPAGQRIHDLYYRWASSAPSDGQSSFEWRLRHWELLIQDWWQNYRILGAGVGQSVNMDGVRFFYGEGAVAHNDWVAILVEFGPMLGAALVLVFTLLLRRVYSLSVHDKYSRAIVAAAIVAVCVAMAGGNVLFTVSFLYLFWLILGATYGSRINGTR